MSKTIHFIFQWAHVLVSVNHLLTVINSAFKGPYHDESMGSIESLAALDLLAVAERDPANESGELLTPYLHFKGFKVIQAHRVSH